MIESRADDQLDEATRAAINALPEGPRSALLRWHSALRQELAEARRGQRTKSEAAGSEADLERERTRVARELHDTIGGDLAASVALFKFYFEHPSGRGSKEEVLTNIYEVLQTTLQNLRGMLRSLRSREVGPAGLVGELRDMATAYQRFHGLDVLLQVSGDEEGLSPAHQEVVFQVVREALSNVRRHAQSGTCLVTCNFAEQPFSVSIKDWGTGIITQNTDGFGLVGMRERAAGIGGRMQVGSAPGRGTTIFLYGPQPTLDSSP
ncbi:MAG: histidine kinase [Candidatus Dormibacteraeota bacterium]|nr:histidine kinase [Candidatus Dormibacteraeota bacterium]